MRNGKFADAEAVYREDLARLPENGWSLYGLTESLRRQGKTDEAETMDLRFKAVWAKADIPLKTSCLCQPAM
jgi:hypothetical protein